jgi:non-lysosomal glucosylceramidase
MARIAFRNASLPVNVSLEAFSPFIPLDAEESGPPVAVLRYRVRNPKRTLARVFIAWSIENPIGATERDVVRRQAGEQRVNEYRETERCKGLLMSNPGMQEAEQYSGTFAVRLVKPAGKLQFQNRAASPCRR